MRTPQNLLAWLVLRRPAGSKAVEARARGTELAQRVWAAYQAAELRDPSIPVEERRVMALLASGRSEAEIRTLVAESTKLSPVHASLQMLTVRVAVQAERVWSVEPAALMQDIVAVQRAVMEVIPSEA